jgi:hypothetical protein
MSQTEIKLGIVRTIKTAEFESLHITAEIKEVVEWSTEEERTKGIQQVVEHLNGDYRRSHVILTESLGVRRSLGTGKLENKRTGEINTANVAADDGEVDIF